MESQELYVQELFERMIDGVDFEKMAEDFNELEKEIINNPIIMEQATSEEMGVYHLLKELPEEDVNKSLENMVEILQEQKELGENEEQIILGMEREFLILLLFSRWIKRANNSASHKKEENSGE